MQGIFIYSARLGRNQHWPLYWKTEGDGDGGGESQSLTIAESNPLLEDEPETSFSGDVDALCVAGSASRIVCVGLGSDLTP